MKRPRVCFAILPRSAFGLTICKPPPTHKGVKTAIFSLPGELQKLTDSCPPQQFAQDLHLDAKDRLRTRLLQVLVKRGGEWQIEVYHNADIKPTVEAPEPK